MMLRLSCFCVRCVSTSKQAHDQNIVLKTEVEYVKQYHESEMFQARLQSRTDLDGMEASFCQKIDDMRMERESMTRLHAQQISAMESTMRGSASGREIELLESVDTLKADIRRFQERALELEEEMSSVEHMHGVQQQQLEQALADARANLQRLQDSSDELTTLRDEALREVAQLKQALGQFKVSLEDLTDANESLEAELEANEARSVLRIRALENELDSLTKAHVAQGQALKERLQPHVFDEHQRALYEAVDAASSRPEVGPGGDAALSSTSSSDNGLKTAFNRFDLDGNGGISTAEFGAVMRTLGYILTEAELSLLILDADIDGSGNSTSCSICLE
jgi:hypothetical protein